MRSSRTILLDTGSGLSLGTFRTVALISKQYECMQAIKATLEADSELAAIVPTWRLQKRAWNRFFKWEVGAYIVPIRSANPAFENRIRRYDIRILVASVFPSDQNLTDKLSERLAVHERIDSFFAYTPMALLPAPIRGLFDQYPGTDNAYSLEKTEAEPGEQFAEGAFQAGLDVLASLITITLTGPKQDYSALGS